MGFFLLLACLAFGGLSSFWGPLQLVRADDGLSSFGERFNW